MKLLKSVTKFLNRREDFEHVNLDTTKLVRVDMIEDHHRTCWETEDVSFQSLNVCFALVDKRDARAVEELKLKLVGGDLICSDIGEPLKIVGGELVYTHRGFDKLVACKLLKAQRHTSIRHLNGNPLDLRRDNLVRGFEHSRPVSRPSVFQLIDEAREKAGGLLLPPRTRVRGGPAPRFRGVSYQNGRCLAFLVMRESRLYLGCYKTPEEAAKAYDEAATYAFGEFAVTNASLGLLSAPNP